MTDHKFTDDDVIKTLKNAKYKVDGVVTQGYYLSPETFNAVVDLIGRQEAEIERLNAVHDDMTESLRLAAEANKDMQAEITRLNKEVDRLSQCVLYHDGIVSDLEKDVFIAKAEAIKEFAENVKAIFECVLYFDDDVKECILNEIDELVKEMTEGNHESQST